VNIQITEKERACLHSDISKAVITLKYNKLTKIGKKHLAMLKKILKKVEVEK